MDTPDVGIVFWILSVVILISALMVVSLKNIFHCALFLILCLFSVAGIYILLHAEFLAAAQVLIYVGAIAMLIIFAIMLTTDLTSKTIRQTSHNAAVAFVATTAFALSTIFLIARTEVWRYSDKPLAGNNVDIIGQYLMTEFMLPFEVVSILLLAAMIGAIVLARKERA